MGQRTRWLRLENSLHVKIKEENKDVKSSQKRVRKGYKS